MSERAYTVREIDDLRACCRDKYIWGSYRGTIRRVGKKMVPGQSYNEQEMIFATEEMVRAHMVAGHTAQGLLLSEGEA